MTDGHPEDDPYVEPTVADVLEAVDVLVGQVEALSTRLSALEDDSPAATTPFEQWVPWLLETFDLSPKLGQWQQVPPVALELQALHAAWCEAFKGNGLPRAGGRAASWYETFDRARPRLDEYMAAHRREQGLGRG